MSDSNKNTNTSLGLDRNVAALLCYVLGFVTGIIFYIIEKDKFIRFHALQSTFTFGTLFILNYVLLAIPIIGWVGNILLAPLTLILWIVLMVKAFQGERFRLPLFGELAEKQLNK